MLFLKDWKGGGDVLTPFLATPLSLSYFEFGVYPIMILQNDYLTFILC